MKVLVNILLVTSTQHILCEILGLNGVLQTLISSSLLAFLMWISFILFSILIHPLPQLLSSFSPEYEWLFWLLVIYLNKNLMQIVTRFCESNVYWIFHFLPSAQKFWLQIVITRYLRSLRNILFCHLLKKDYCITSHFGHTWKNYLPFPLFMLHISDSVRIFERIMLNLTI